MSSINSQDRASLCRFTFADGRRCRMPRFSGHPDFCHYHGERDARDRAAAQLGHDLAFLFSRDYISAADLTAGMSRLLVAIARGYVKPRAARTMAFLFQTLVYAHKSVQHEYINAYNCDAWLRALRHSFHQNSTFAQSPASSVGTGLASPEGPGFRSSHASAARHAERGEASPPASTTPGSSSPTAPNPKSPADLPMGEPRSTGRAKLPADPAAFASAVAHAYNSSQREGAAALKSRSPEPSPAAPSTSTNPNPR